MNESRRTCRVVDCIWANITNACDSKRATKQHEVHDGVAYFQHHRRPDCQSKTTWNQVCVLARYKLWRFFLAPQNFINNRYSTCMLLWKKTLQFPREIWAAKAHTSGEKNCFRGENKINFRDQSRLTVSSRPRLRRSISRSRLRRARLCSNTSMLTGYVIKGITGKIMLSQLTFRLYTPHTTNSYNEQTRECLRKREILPNSRYCHFITSFDYLGGQRNAGNTTAYYAVPASLWNNCWFSC